MDFQRNRGSLCDLARLQTLVEESGLDAVLASSPENVTYSTGLYDPGFRTMRNRLHVAVWPADGEPVFVVPEYRLGADTLIGDTRGYDFYVRDEVIEDQMGRARIHRWPVDVLVEVLRERGLLGGRIGIEKDTFPTGAYEALRKEVPETQFVDCHSLFDEARMVKTAAEIELLQEAGTITEKAIQFAFELARPGAKARRVAEEIGCLLTRLGADQVAFVQLDVLRGGRRLSFDRDSVTLREGDWLRVDAGGYFSGYYSDVARMAVVDSPGEEPLSIYQRLLRVQKTIVQAILRPGAVGSELFHETREAFGEEGFDTPWGMIVHGIGLHIHERPWIREQENYRLLPGMVLCVEAISHGPADEMWHIEDLVLITGDGARELTCHADTTEPFVIV